MYGKIIHVKTKSRRTVEFTFPTVNFTFINKKRKIKSQKKSILNSKFAIKYKNHGLQISRYFRC